MKLNTIFIKISALAFLISSIVPLSAFAEGPENLKAQNKFYTSNVQVLKDHGVLESDIQELGADIYPLANEISNKNLSKTQIENYINGIKQANEQSTEVEQNRKHGIMDTSTQVTSEVIDGQVTLPDGDKITVPNRNKMKLQPDNEVTQGIAPLVTLGDGPMYNVDARVGYNQITSMVTLPTVKSTTESGIIPYVLGGAYVTTNNVNYTGGADIGAFYEKGVWRLCINAVNSTGSQYYWTSSQTTLPNGTVYLNYKVSANNQVQITASDENYNYITSISYYFNDINLKADGSNVEMAYKNVKSISDGSYLLNGSWNNTYVYKPTGYSLMDSSTVVHASKKGTADEIAKISVTTSNPYYKYSTSIDFR